MLLCAVAIVPSIIASECSLRSDTECATGWETIDRWLKPLWHSLRHADPIIAVNALFFLNVTVGFWLIGLVQRSFWLIDPYWTLLPPLIGVFFRRHPTSLDPPPLRANIAMALTLVWSARLTHNYVRPPTHAPPPDA
jgi:hypothetical protein